VMRVAVTGARGQLGAVAVRECARLGGVTPFDHAALDITDAQAVGVAIGRVRPDLIINCAGYNAVDAAEDHPVLALQANAFAVRSLARAARTYGSMLIQFSSDFVFDGSRSTPHAEDEQPTPRSVYAFSKLLGEWFAADAPHAYILRVESLFGAAPGVGPDKGSVAAIVSALRAGHTPKVFGDRTVSPTYVHDAVRAVCELVERNAPAGLYHLVNSGACTWVEFATEAARLLGVEPRFDVIRMADIRLRAPRPLYSAMSNQKLASLGIVMPTWQDALKRYVSAT
jgi:dTDP-4-dehydrorhamnose reductase